VVSKYQVPVFPLGGQQTEDVSSGYKKKRFSQVLILWHCWEFEDDGLKILIEQLVELWAMKF
jgi:hypothetical protein